jgi:hypothetical protein
MWVPSESSNHPSKAPVMLVPNWRGGSLGSCLAATAAVLAMMRPAQILTTNAR